MGTYVVAITGASGSVYGLAVLRGLLAAGHEATLVATDMGSQVTAYETGIELPGPGAEDRLRASAGLPAGKGLRIVAPDDMFDRIASGSDRFDGMVVAPCSMGFAGRVASGIADDLPARAADVCLKERRPLVLVPRETPLSLVHLRNLTALAEAGAVVLPAMPGFYHRPSSVDDLVAHVAGKVLDVLGVEHATFGRWGAEPSD